MCPLAVAEPQSGADAGSDGSRPGYITPSRGLRQPTCQAGKPTDAPVPDIDRFAEHHRAGARNDRDVVRTAEGDGRRGDAARPHSSVHPHTRDAEVDARANDLLCGLRRRHRHDTVETDGYRREVRVAAVAFDLFGVGVDGVHIVPGIAELPVDEVSGLPRVTRDARYRDAASGEEGRSGFVECSHGRIVLVQRARYGPPGAFNASPIRLGL